VAGGGRPGGARQAGGGRPGGRQAAAGDPMVRREAGWMMRIKGEGREITGKKERRKINKKNKK